MKKEIFYLKPEQIELIKWFIYPAGRRTASQDLKDLIEKNYFQN